MTRYSPALAVVLMAVLTGCATRGHVIEPAISGGTRITVIEPRYCDCLEIERAYLDVPTPASSLADLQVDISKALPPTRAPVAGAFFNAVVSALESKGYVVERVSNAQLESGLRRPFDGPVIATRLTVGFVNKTFTSNSYAPYV